MQQELYKSQKTKMVGIVVPIYNVEKYLKECLDSIINQTYKNLSILLVNDGSSDESLDIAKEYARKDSRILIIDKENGGLASARNVGIEFFSGEIEIVESPEVFNSRLPQLDKSSLAMTQNQRVEFHLNTFTIAGENPYQIHTIYSTKSTLEIPHIDYLQFVDSDDYIELDCVERCVKRMQGVEILWFDAKTFLDGVKKSDWKSNIYHFGYTQEVILSRKDWVQRIFERRLHFFYFSWSGVIDFEFLKRIKLKFINGIVQEDDVFGILLFAQSKNIYVYPNKLYHYRIRANSIMNYGNNFEAKVAGFFAKNTEVFKDNYSKRQYHKAISFMLTSLALHDFLENSKNERLKHIIGKYLMPTYVLYASKILYFSKDPLELIPKFEILFPYIQELETTHLTTNHFKESLAYRLGGLILSYAKTPSGILRLPMILQETIALDKSALKAYKANVKKYDLQMPNLKDRVDKIERIKTKQHLSFKLGSCILSAHRFRYLGGYFWLPFGILWSFIKFKSNALKREKDSVFLDEMKSLKAQIQHLNNQIWQTSRNPQNGGDLNAKLQDLGIPREHHNAFLSLYNEGKKILSYTKDMRFLEMLLELRSQIYHFEPDPLLYAQLGSRYGDSINLYNRGLAGRESHQIVRRDTKGNGNHPSIYYANKDKFSAQFASVSCVIRELGRMDCFVLELDFETYPILLDLIQTQTIENIGFICAKVAWEFKESQAFKSLLEEVDSKTTNITPPQYFIFL